MRPDAGKLVTVNCPRCKIPSMDVVRSGEVEVDRCRTCGAAWFDPGEIRELTQGRWPVEEDPPASSDPSLPAKGEKESALRRAWAEARALSCPRCGTPLRPFDFQNTGVPVFPMPRLRRGAGLAARCENPCRPMRVPAGPRGALRSPRRLHGGRGPGPDEPPARPGRRRGGCRADPGAGPRSLGGRGIPRVASPPGGVRDPPPHRGPASVFPGRGGRPGRSTGTPGPPCRHRFSGVPKFALLSTPSFTEGSSRCGGLSLPLRPGDNVEDRLGRVPFLLFYLFCGAVAGMAHVLWGSAGMPAALGRPAPWRGCWARISSSSRRADRHVRDGQGRHRPRLPLRVRLGGIRLPLGMGPGAALAPARSRTVQPCGAPCGFRDGRAGAVFYRSVE